jgi:hypothetical protein
VGWSEEREWNVDVDVKKLVVWYSGSGLGFIWGGRVVMVADGFSFSGFSKPASFPSNFQFQGKGSGIREAAGRAKGAGGREPSRAGSRDGRKQEEGKERMKIHPQILKMLTKCHFVTRFSDSLCFAYSQTWSFPDLANFTSLVKQSSPAGLTKT